MSATRSLRFGALVAFSLAAWLAAPSIGRAQATKPTTTPEAKAKAKTKAAETKDPVDLNSATVDELTTLPGIGEANARKIIDGRPHKSAADLAKAGIPASAIAKLEPMVVATPLPAPVNVNADSAAQLETLPGVGPAMVREIIAGRPFATYDDLEKLKGMGPKKLDALKGRLAFGKADTVAKKAEAKKVEVEKATTETKKATVEKAEVKKAETTAVAKEKMARASEKATIPPGTKININKATREELDALPGIGVYYSQAIIDARPFSTIEDIMKIKGIKEVEFGKIKDMITVK